MQNSLLAGLDSWLDKLIQPASAIRSKPVELENLPVTLYDFVLDRGFLVDKKPMDFDRHRYLVPIYQSMQFRPEVEEDFDRTLMTGAQVGKSITALTLLIYAAQRFWGGKFGYFLPDREMADIFSSDRFLPIVQSNPSLAQYLSTETRVKGAKKEDRKRVRSIGETTIFFSYMGGKTSTEAIPMDGVFFDEVRRMLMGDIERAHERISHASYPVKVKISTAGYPDTTIDHFFKRSTQHYFHTRCGCADGVVLAEVWPECLGESEGKYFWRCPMCSTVIADPQDGEFRPRTPENHGLGFHVPQILSPVMSPKRLWEKWMNMTDRQEFYNSSLGLPFIDPASILVPLEVAQACEDVSLRWMGEGINCVMGVDQRGGENHVVIGEPTKGGRKLALRHLEIIQGDSPFDRLYPLMERYDVDCCIIDALPSYNEAVKFAKAFKRRVFLSYYSDNVHMLRWSDRDEELQALYRAKPDSKFEFHVMLDRYKAIEFALMYWVNRLVACPPAAALVQEVRVKGVKRMSQICLGNPETGEQGLFYHLRSVARRKIAAVTRDSQKRETIDTGAFRMVWENIGIDPHFLHAFLYCVMASQRKQVTAELWTPEGNTGARVTVEETKKQKPDATLTQAGDMAQIQTAMRALPAGPSYLGQCGSCESFQAERKHCQARGFSVRPDMPACEEYQEKGD